MGAGLNASAGFLGFGGDSWKEEVLLHDGQKLIVERSQSYGGRHEIGQPAPIKEQSITFTLPNTSKSITWKDESTEDIGHANFDLLALHVINNTPYIVTSPNLCISYNKWGRPTPPYIFFKYDGKSWQKIPLSEFPAEFKDINLVIDDVPDRKELTDHGAVSAQSVKRLNSSLTQEEYKTITRTPIEIGCPVLVPIKGGGWQSPGGFKAPISIKPTDSNQKKQ
jgi:hypothetical protein